ncbi:DnaB-like helicase N-terminal domain-containing protein [Streptomyces sp. NPDC059913]|uniref:DnaB-like helicase N-terminal domain-containing protein n=1 Tax=unclassified Streptomyces TaxID=2593676 RepID=UPI00364ECF32
MNPLLRAEQAVLGAVLIDPGQLAHLDWLGPDDFDRPVHRALFAALRKLRDASHRALSAKGPVPLAWVTDAVAEAGGRVRGLTAVYAHSLISACPRSEHAPVYGRMVLEGAVHRSIAQHAVRLHQAARADAVRGEVDDALQSAEVLAGVIGDLAHRWGTELRPVPSTALPTTTADAPSGAEHAAEDEQFLLAVLAGQPGAMDAVVDWLRPDDFADPAHGQLYRCLGALHHRDEPIDRVTLLWEAQRRGLLADATLSSNRIAAICDGVGAGTADWLGQRVLRASVTRIAGTSARAVRALAEDESLAAGRLITHSLHALGPLDDVRKRWEAANRVNPPPSYPSTTSSSHQARPHPARAHAALARSAPRPASPSPAKPPSSATPPAPRPPSRGHG